MTIDTLVGKTLTAVSKSDDYLRFDCDNGDAYALYHSQDCCEYVRIEEVIGDLNDLVGHPILKAEEATSEGNPGSESATWTFYTIATIKGTVVVRWLGESNGYYSESVHFAQVSGNASN